MLIEAADLSMAYFVDRWHVVERRFAYLFIAPLVHSVLEANVALPLITRLIVALYKHETRCPE